MPTIVEEISNCPQPEALLQRGAHALPGTVLLRSGLFSSSQARYSYLAVQPFLTFQAFGSCCEIQVGSEVRTQYGNPWLILESLIPRYEILDEVDLPFPLGGCFGFWGYDLRSFTDRCPQPRAQRDYEFPDCWVGFYDSLLVIDHHLGRGWIVSTGMMPDGTRSPVRAAQEVEAWLVRIRRAEESPSFAALQRSQNELLIQSNFTRDQFLKAVGKAQEYIRQGHIYQVNLAQRFESPFFLDPWAYYEAALQRSPAPFASYLHTGNFSIVSSSPELFLKIHGQAVQTRPIKGTRPRSADPTRDAQLTYELQTSPKEMAELVMITDLLRNDLGRVCEYGTVHVPELVRLERFPHVQHLVSTVEGELRSDLTHLHALMRCFPGGSITGAPKLRAMEIIDELEPVARGPYTGSLGYIGFNRESQFNILIRSAFISGFKIYYSAGAGIVADSDPAAEYEETLAKARGFFDALELIGNHPVGVK